MPGDGKNLNRTFPGDPRGSYTEVLADLLWQRIASRRKPLLDIHGGELVEGLVPFTGAYAMDGQERRRARFQADSRRRFDTAYLVLNQVPAAGQRWQSAGACRDARAHPRCAGRGWPAWADR